MSKQAVNCKISSLLSFIAHFPFLFDRVWLIVPLFRHIFFGTLLPYLQSPHYQTGRKAAKHRAMADSSTSATTAIEQDLQHEKVQSKRFKSEASLYKNMARTYWDRWQWELHKRKEAMTEQLRRSKSRSQIVPTVHEIDTNDLKDPIVDGVSKEVFIGRGSFSVVRLQQYRGIRVAVKEFLSRTLKEDIQAEATFLAKLCHPFLPHLFGISLSSDAMKLVSQFHGISDETTHNPR